MADWPPLDPYIFCKINILSHINAKREETLGANVITHDLTLDRISRRFNEMRLSLPEKTEEEIQEMVRKEFNVSNVDLGQKGKEPREN